MIKINWLIAIVSTADGVASAIDEISRASVEQARGVEEMASTVAKLDELTDKNSSLAKTSANVAAELLQDAVALASLARGYKLAPVQAHADHRASIAA